MHYFVIWVGDPVPDPDDYVDNIHEGSTIKIIGDPIDNTTPNEGELTVRVKYPEGGSQIVKVPFEVRDRQPIVPINPIPDLTTRKISIYVGDKVPEYKDFIDGLPEGSTIEIVKDPIDNTRSYEGETTIRVHFKDGGSTTVRVPFEALEK